MIIPIILFKIIINRNLFLHFIRIIALSAIGTNQEEIKPYAWFIIPHLVS